ncbi:hypothetical protein [Nonomuraea zeae]|uniref:Uncharacterized protein n=3 Tax=Nonomuraea zeae TaxID=1642303 RepID=A0A5S4FVQ1_9ACTN|nr:hypothetical protein [Nonomuraea zeae]TMR24846.1 hypothetical protein ETD85_46125 [Nonomuraea zeae]
MRPTGWRGALGEAYTEWTRRDRSAHLGVEALYSNLDPNQIMRDAEETVRQNAESVVNRSRRTVVHQGTKAVEWEFTWTAGAAGDTPWVTPGTRYREVRRAVAIGDTAYILSWTATEAQWLRNRGLMRQVISSFTVGA